MNTLRFGIDFIDQHLNDLPENNIYFIYEEEPTVKNIFVQQLINYNLSLSHSVLYLTNLADKESMNTVAHYLDSQNRLKNVINNNLLILEIPKFLNILIKDTFDMNHILNDLKIYLDYQKPDLLIIQNLHLLFLGNQEALSTTFLSQLLNFLNHISSTVFIDLSSFSFKYRNICEKFASGLFEIQKANQSNNYQLTIKKFKNIKQHLPIVFTLDLDNNIIPSLFKNRPYHNLNECKHVLLKKGFESYEKYFKEIVSADIRFSYYDDIESFKKLTFNEVNALVIIPSNVLNLNGWQFTSWVRRNYPLCSIILVGSINIPANQKVRAIKIGADKVISFPILFDELKEAIEIVYYSEENSENDITRHNVLFADKVFIKNINIKLLSKNPFIRMVKEFVLESLQKGFSLQFFKVKANVNSINEINDNLKNCKEIIFLSTMVLHQEPFVLFIYQNLSFSQIKFFRQQIALNFKQIKSVLPEHIHTNSFYSNILNIRKSELLASETDVSTDNIHFRNYPLEETDIDNIIQWIYEPIVFQQQGNVKKD